MPRKKKGQRAAQRDLVTKSTTSYIMYLESWNTEHGVHIQFRNLHLLWISLASCYPSET